MSLELGQRADHGFDEPLGLLSDCHRRIERFLLAMLTVARAERGRALTPSNRRVLEQALAYFATAGPRHTEDEESSLFPLLRRHQAAAARDVMALVDRLEQDHRETEAGHRRVDDLVRRWFVEGALDAASADDLVQTLESLDDRYRDHIGAEDRLVFPTAGRLLSPRELEAIGREMAERRNVPYAPPADLQPRR